MDETSAVCCRSCAVRFGRRFFNLFILSPGVTGLAKLAGAEKLLNSIDENVLFLKYCGSDCEIIGRCQFQPNTRNRVLSFSSLDDTIGHTVQ
jgi:hypothetical protein